MPLSPAVSELARRTMKTAFEELERTVTPADSRAFRSSTLEQIRIEALDIESQLAARQALCNMRRLDSLLTGIEHYSSVVGILCNGTPFLPWIWAPITMILRVASEYADSFQQIMKGYTKIADALGRFKILSDTFIAEAGFQQTLAVFYADILQFHTQAYRFVRRSGWKLLFLTSWGRFQRRFDNILEDLDRHGKLVDQEANARNVGAVAQMRQENSEWREKSLDKISRDEKLQASKEYESILSWLKVDQTEQTQIVEAISDEEMKFPGACSWLLNDTKVKSWLRNKPEQPFLWIQGNAGCGKSVIAAKLVNLLRLTESLTQGVIGHFCTFTFPSSTRYDGILKSIVWQLLSRSDELIAHVYQECIVGKKQIGTNYLERLIQTLITALCDRPGEPLCVWIVVDGINECETAKQVRLINLMIQMSSLSTSAHGVTYKVLLTTRPSVVIKRYFKVRRNQVIDLSDERSPLHSAIRTYVARRMESMHDRLRQMELESHEIQDIEKLVSQKASGMFLYARLVLDYIHANLFYSGAELRAAINELPESLNEFYQKLLSQILARLNEQSQERVRCIFGWIAFAKRPLKKLEFLSALSFTSGNHELTKLVPRYIVEDICSPLIEERRDGSLTFIHVSVKDFLQTTSSAVILREEQTLHEHGTAAVSCLLSGLYVLDKSYDEQTKLLRFVKGIHGFHVYATEYWTEYLLANAAITGGLKDGLLEVAMLLATALDKSDTSAPELSESRASTDSKDDRLELLQNYGTLRKHVERSIFARSLRRFESELQTSILLEGSVPKQFKHHDGISAALDLYQTTVEILLGQDSCPGASVEDLEIFKNQFRTSAYTCRLRSCPRATVGFRTHHLRHEHEVSHAGGFRCSFAGCQYPPYRSQRTLSAHINSVHSPAVILPRRSIRRVGNLGREEKSSIARLVSRPRSRSIPARQPASMGPRPRANASTDETDDKIHTAGMTPSLLRRISEEPRLGDKVLTSDIGRDFDVGVGYLDTVMERITGGMVIDPALYERLKASFIRDMDAVWNLGEVADDLRDDSANTLTPDVIITKIWSKGHPELAQELKQFVRASYLSHTAGQSIPQSEHGDHEMEATSSRDVHHHCSCGGKDTDDMIACDNATCPNGWSHRSCVKRVIKSFENEKWFCSSACREANEAQESDEDGSSDSDDY